MSNLYRAFKQLSVDTPVYTGQVSTHNADGSSTVILTGGGPVRVLGQSVAIGNKVFVKGNEILGEAPNLTSYNLDV